MLALHSPFELRSAYPAFGTALNRAPDQEHGCCYRAGYALNLYWMEAILRGAFRALSRSKASKGE